jgi:hypothetical protein
MNTYQRETVEHQPVTVTVNGAVTADSMKFAVVPTGSRPTTWLDPVTVDGKPGVMIQGYQPGVYTVFVQVTANPETPVENAGQFQVV